MPTTCAKKPREFILSAAKDDVVGVRVFSVRASSVSWLVFTSLYRRLPHRKWLFNQSSMSC